MSYISGTKNDQKLNLLNLTKYKFFVKYFKKQCYGRIICVLLGKIICGHRGEGVREVERDGDMSHLRSLRREDLRWQRKDVITVEGYLFLIRGWAIVRRLVR